MTLEEEKIEAFLCQSKTLIKEIALTSNPEALKNFFDRFDQDVDCKSLEAQIEVTRALFLKYLNLLRATFTGGYVPLQQR